MYLSSVFSWLRISAGLFLSPALLLGVVLLAASGCAPQEEPLPVPAEEVPATAPGSSLVYMDTTQGDIFIETSDQLMPLTAGNFLEVVKSGYYSGNNFHRVEETLVQGGSKSGTGTGGPRWSIPLETNDRISHTRGAVSMARTSAPDSASVQIFICKQDCTEYDGDYAAFGRVIRGMDVVDKLRPGDLIRSARVVRTSLAEEQIEKKAVEARLDS